MMWQKKCFPVKRDNERGCCSIDDSSSILQQPLLSSQVYHKQRSTHHEMSASLYGDAYGIRTHECQRERLVSSAASPTRHVVAVNGFEPLTPRV